MNISGVISTIALGLALSLAGAAHAQNWPSFRGPNASGIADSQPLPTMWDAEKSVNILWKAPLPGLGHSSPVVWGDRVFVTLAISSATNPNHNPKDDDIEPSNDQSAHQWQVYCLDKRTGKVLRLRTAHRGVPKVRRHVKATQANATPATDGRVVVVSFGSEGLYGYDMDGNLLWKQDLGVLDPGYADSPNCPGGLPARRSSIRA